MWFSLSDDLVISLPRKLISLGKVVEQNLDFQRRRKDPLYAERLDAAYKATTSHAHEVVHGIILQFAESKGIPVAVLTSKDESGCTEWSYMFDWSDREKGK